MFRCPCARPGVTDATAPAPRRAPGPSYGLPWAWNQRPRRKPSNCSKAGCMRVKRSCARRSQPRKATRPKFRVFHDFRHTAPTHEAAAGNPTSTSTTGQAAPEPRSPDATSAQPRPASPAPPNAARTGSSAKPPPSGRSRRDRASPTARRRPLSTAPTVARRETSRLTPKSEPATARPAPPRRGGPPGAAPLKGPARPCDATGQDSRSGRPRRPS